MDTLTIEFVKQWIQDPEVSKSYLPFKRYQDKELLGILIDACCPIVCTGISTPPENWHDLCIEKAINAFKILRGKD